MTRTTVATIIFFATILVVTMAILLKLDQTLPDNAQTALNKFLQYRYPSPALAATVSQSVHATMPSKFTPDMSGTTFGESHFYRTTVDYADPVNINLPNLATATPGLTSATYWRGSTPLPFPPEDAWCVVLKEENQPEQIVIIALHSSLYNAEWLVHEPPAEPGSAEMNTILSTIGCKLK